MGILREEGIVPAEYSEGSRTSIRIRDGEGLEVRFETCRGS
jgi:hypothetical protein